MIRYVVHEHRFVKSGGLTKAGRSINPGIDMVVNEVSQPGNLIRHYILNDYFVNEAEIINSGFNTIIGSGIAQNYSEIIQIKGQQTFFVGIKSDIDSEIIHIDANGRVTISGSHNNNSHPTR